MKGAGLMGVSMYWRRWRVSLSLVLCLAGSAWASGDSGDSGGVRVSGDMSVFLRSYVSLAAGDAAHIRLPAVWLYTPEGMLVARLQGEDELAGIPLRIKSPGAAPLSPVKFSQVTKIAESMGVSISPPGDAQWTALLLSSAQCWAACEPYRDGLREVIARSQGQLRVVDFTLER